MRLAWLMLFFVFGCVAPAMGDQVLTVSATPALAIPDNWAAGVTSTINVPNAMIITSVSVNVGITHTYQGDLEVALIGPDNTTVLLHNKTGGSIDNINTTYNITTRSAQALTAFNGKSTSGAWNLRVRDLAAVDTGTLNSWTVTFNGYYTLTINTAIPDNNATGITSTINVPATGTIVSLRVLVDITHTFQGDLEVALIGPDNTTVLLHNRTGASADNIKTVYADLTAPAQALAAFTGKAINGAWKLRVRDLAAVDTGMLNFWEIDFRAGSCPPNKPTTCGSQCVNLQNDVSNCGSCGTACTVAGQVCSNGQCACPSGTTLCQNACVNDHDNCGGCGIACTSLQRCCSGTCVALLYNCKTCNDDCINHWCKNPYNSCVQKMNGCISGKCTNVDSTCAGDFTDGTCTTPYP
jgi:subtilisin-like proprotein convertase family protein